MIYSVWNYGTRQYDYYKAGVAGPIHAGTAPKAIVSSPLGATPEQAAWPVPVGAVKVGSGTQARGRIASFGDVSTTSSMMIPLVAIVASVYFLARWSA